MQGALRLGAIAFVLGLGACDTGAVGPGGPGPGGPDSQVNPVGVLCMATFKVSGTYVQSEAQPTEVTGCWPVGSWTFNATMDTNMCQTAPSVLPSYQFTVGETMDVDGNYDYTYQFNTDPTAHTIMKVSGDGGGLCQGGFEIFSPDGKQIWNMKPSLETGNVLDGFGEYALYDADQWN